MFFTKEALSKISTIGSIQPGSKYLIAKCLKDVEFKKNQIILEFGSGNGNFTAEILKRIPTSSKLISFETNKKFFEHCLEKFKSYENFEIHNCSAEKFIQVSEIKGNNIDYVISSLPLSLLNKELIESIVQKVMCHLKPKGCFIQYQYSFDKYLFLRNKFNTVKLNFVVRNLPPSFVYKCYK
ncbi:methyltransferase domain-containing protein [Polaribacter sp.]|nr:methyltransferase domain-containing protein [Polaribacter sp.]|tara:strand:+ start:2988 stop:3533 length:546 start_codon:yes stop_codon:yes gene_type:complete